MEMVMPNTYSVLENEEMMYLEGGGVPRWMAAATIDIILLTTPVGIATAPMKALGNGLAAALVRRYAPQIAGVAGNVLQGVLGMTINASSAAMTNLIVQNAATFTSVGGVIAFLGDYYDGNLNGWVF